MATKITETATCARIIERSGDTTSNNTQTATAVGKSQSSKLLSFRKDQRCQKFVRLLRMHIPMTRIVHGMAQAGMGDDEIEAFQKDIPLKGRKNDSAAAAKHHDKTGISLLQSALAKAAKKKGDSSAQIAELERMRESKRVDAANASRRVGPNLDQILPGLYLGDVMSAQNVTALEELGITHVLTVMKMASMGDDYQVNVPDGIVHKIVEVLDIHDAYILPHLHSCCDFIDAALKHQVTAIKKGAILVHCFAGVSRSASVVVAYIMRRFESLSTSDAISLVRSFRGVVRPNHSFEKQLKFWSSDRARGGDQTGDIVKRYLKSEKKTRKETV